MTDDSWGTMVDANGNGVDFDIVFRDAQAHDAGPRVERLLLVEDEIADAVVNGLALVGLGGLQGMGVVADEDVGSGINDGVGFEPLLGQRA